MRSLHVYPTHSNCHEVERLYLNAGIDVATYPARQTKDSDDQTQNCWNTDADIAENMGFPVVKTVCAVCPHHEQCAVSGYLRQLITAKKAIVSLCTQKRVELSGFSDLAGNRDYVSIHEDPINLLRPRADASEEDLRLLKVVPLLMLNDPWFLDWFGDDMAVDDEGNPYHSEEKALRRQRLYDATVRVAVLVDDLIRTIQSTDVSTEWSPIDCRKLPEGFERTLFFATRSARVRFFGNPWRFVLAAASGSLSSSAILVSKPFTKGGARALDKLAVGFRQNHPPRHAVVWFNDATIEPDRIVALLGGAVHEWTPNGRLPLQKKAVQILRDVTQNTTLKTVANVLRGVLADRPQFQRIGLIGHRKHMGVVKTLGSDFAPRIVKKTYFGSGEERSSNEWTKECDLIIVCGTPRIPPDAVAAYLLQVGDVASACREGKWDKILWEGHTESGELVKVPSRGYLDEAWRRANREKVRSTLVQAIGRGRGILESGCEVIVLSNEECGLPISDDGLRPLNGSSVRVLEVLARLSPENPIQRYIGKSGVSTERIAKAISLSVSQARDLLGDLEHRGLVRKVGERGGWMPVAQALSDLAANSAPVDPNQAHS